MSTVMVRIPTPLRSFTGGADEVRAEGAMIGEVLKALSTVHTGLLEQVMSPQGELRNFVNVYLGGENVRSLKGLATPVSDNDVISIVPAVAGGAGKVKDRRLAELKAVIPPAHHGGLLVHKPSTLAPKTTGPCGNASLLAAVGRTPLIELDLVADLTTNVRLFAKLESSNPGGSLKDRPVARMICQALDDGRLADGRRLLDSSSGNAGIAYAMIGAR